MTDDFPGLAETIRKIFSETDWQLCVLHAARDVLNQVRRKDQDALAEDLKAVYKAETQERRLRENLGSCASVEKQHISAS